MNLEIMEKANERGITRLCHFTPSRNLVHIASGSTGILATRRLQENERAAFNQTDLQRLDGFVEYICCTIEYPNVWFLDKVKDKDILFRDWVILCLRPKYIWEDKTLFCPRNAAARGGAFVQGGVSGFKSLFEDSVVGTGSRTFRRARTRLACCPTDEQAEVLVWDRIPHSDILAVIVSSETQARNEISRLKLLDVPRNLFQFIVAPVLFDKNRLHEAIERGDRPAEMLWSKEYGS